MAPFPSRGRPASSDIGSWLASGATKVVFVTALLATLGLFAARQMSLGEFLHTIDWQLVILVGSFMLVSEALRRAGIMSWLASSLTKSRVSTGYLYYGLVGSAFIISMLVTNDAALFTVIPLSAAFTKRAGLNFPRLAVYEIAAVNLGSSLTPWGNPQNLIIYSHYQLQLGAFFACSVLLAAAGAAALLAITYAALARRPHQAQSSLAQVDRPPLPESLLLGGLFLLLVLGATHTIPIYIAASPLVLYELLRHRGHFRGVDWWLLAAFALLFPVMDRVSALIFQGLKGWGESPWEVFLTGAGLSQFLSNVPTALLLTHTTTHWQSLFWGVNVGGLGTPAASFANLIGISLYRQLAPAEERRRFWQEFALWNAVLLGVLMALGSGILR